MSARKTIAAALTVACAMAAVMVLASSSALAAPPETPEALEANPVTGTSATLHGILNPGGPGEAGVYQFRYWPSATECEHEGEWLGESGLAEGHEKEAVVATVNELLPGATYTFCLVLYNFEGEVSAHGAPRMFTTPLIAPGLGAAEIAEVGATEATVATGIDPATLPTGYRVEYGETSAYGSTTPEMSAGAGSEAVPVRVRLSGLTAGAAYHFRFVASNAVGMTSGEDETFSTVAAVGASASTLPDGRVYELVSSPTNNQTVDSLQGNDHGSAELFGDEPSDQPFRAASDGDGLAYPGEPGPEGGNGAFGDGFSNEWIATRGATGWSSTDITPPGTDNQTEYFFFSTDLSVGIFFADDATPIVATPPAPNCWNLFQRSADGNYHPLAVLPVGSGGAGCGFPADPYASGNNQHLLFEDEGALTAGSAPGNGYDPYNIYDSAGGALHQVNVLPDGSPEQKPAAWLGAAPSRGNAPANFSNAVSFDGSRVFWSSVEQVGSEEEQIPKALYVRENDTQPQSPLGGNGECTVSTDACTVQVDAGESQCVQEGKCKSGGGVFWTASADGSRVLFTDTNRLTANSTAAPGSPDLYRYEVNGETGKPGVLLDLTADQGGAPADVQGVIGTAEDGSHVYFVADGVLTQTSGPEGKQPIAGTPNLYLADGRSIAFIATLAPSDDGIGARLYNESAGDWSLSPSNRTAAVTPSGQGVVFESFNSLTGYDNRDTAGEAEVEVFVYNTHTGRIACASCDPTGARPIGKPSFDLSAYTPLPVTGGGGQKMNEYMPRWLSADGSRVFFDTVQSLVPQDTNGHEDVYEWERNGYGSCAVAAPGAPEKGCTYLLSGGQGQDNSFFADADVNGDNVFFTSRGRLAPQASGENIAMYDARAGGGFPEPKTACVGAGCQGVPPAPPVFATPSSVTFSGVGNFEPAPTKTTSRKKPVKCKRGSATKGRKCRRSKTPKKHRPNTHARKGSKR